MAMITRAEPVDGEAKGMSNRIVLGAVLVAVFLIVADLAHSVDGVRTMALAAVGAAVLVIVWGLVGKVAAARAFADQKDVELAARDVKIKDIDGELERAREYTTLIVESVIQGVFRMDSLFIIRDGYSKKLEQTFRAVSLARRSLLDVLEPLLPERALDTAREHLHRVFDDRMSVDDLDAANPLTQVEINFPSEDGAYESRYLDFGFRRIVKDGHIVGALVTVQDVSERVNLETELREAEARKDRQVELLLGVLHVRPSDFEAFMQTAREHMARINAALRTQDFSVAKSGQTTIFRQRLETVYRSVNEIKKKAETFELKHFVRISKEFEDKIVSLRSLRTLSGEKLVTILVSQAEIERDLDELQHVRDRSSAVNFGAVASSNGASQEDEVLTSMARIAVDIAGAVGKKVRVTAVGFDTRRLGPEVRNAVRDVLTQFTTNAVIHGAETSDERARRGKAEEATITIQAKTDPASGTFGFAFRDDGRGIDSDAIRRSAVTRRLLAPEVAERMEARSLIGLIFQPGFSTMEQKSNGEARGFGLNVVKEIVRDRFQGKISVATEPGQFTEFSVTIPLMPRTVEPKEVAKPR